MSANELLKASDPVGALKALSDEVRAKPGDADMWLGPVLEAFVNGKYYWVPYARLSHIKLDPPQDLRDCSGQRVLSSDAGEHALMDVREILFNEASNG